MSAVRRLGLVAMVALALTLAGCTTSTVKPTGVVTGYAEACTGLAPFVHAPPRVTVLLYSGPTVVASVTFRSGDTYRFSVTSGSYTVKVRQGYPSHPSYQSYPPKGVVVRAGRTTSANFPSYCK